MLIAPTDKDKGWSLAAATERAIVAWEAETALRLPEAYRRFMIRFDGGYVWPNMFTSAIIEAGIIPSSDTAMFIDTLYSFDLVLGHWRKDTYGDGTPPGMVFVGDNPGGTEIVMSVRPHDFGVIYLWYHSTNIWGTDGNDDSALIRQADSFPAFLQSLYDDTDKSGYEAWYIPYYAEPGVVQSFEIDEFAQ